jgi:hypothetical protein
MQRNFIDLVKNGNDLCGEIETVLNFDFPLGARAIKFLKASENILGGVLHEFPAEYCDLLEVVQLMEQQTELFTKVINGEIN